MVQYAKKTDRELWGHMTASEIRAIRKAEAKMEENKKAREVAKAKKELEKPNHVTISASCYVPQDIANQFKAKLKKDKLKAKDIFDIAIYQYINGELHINKEQPKKENQLP